MPRTIYFAGSITGGRADVAIYRRMIEALQEGGFRVLAGAVAAEDLTPDGEPLERSHIFTRDLGWIDESDLLVAEVSMPSAGVGYEIAYARHARRIPVICLFRPAHTRRCSAMIGGDAGIRLIEYTEDGLASAIETLLRLAGE